MVFKEIIAVYTENHTKHVNKMQKHWLFQLVVHTLPLHIKGFSVRTAVEYDMNYKTNYGNFRLRAQEKKRLWNFLPIFSKCVLRHDLFTHPSSSIVLQSWSISMDLRKRCYTDGGLRRLYCHKVALIARLTVQFKHLSDGLRQQQGRALVMCRGACSSAWASSSATWQLVPPTAPSHSV
jgi:hypothetical protein